MIKFQKEQLDTVNIPRQAVELLLTAPEGALRLYLLGLVREEGDAEQLMQELSLTREQLFTALDWLAFAGLVTPGPEGLAYQALRPLPPVNEAVYKDAKFNAVLQAIFTDRELVFEDYRVLYECIDVYGMSKQVLPILAETCITLHRSKNRLPMAYLRDRAREWVRDGIDTPALAEERKQAMLTQQESAAEVLRLLGIRRRPSEEENLLYAKWTGEWGFSFAAIRAAMPATTKAQYPTMAYLDGILSRLKADGAVTLEAVTGSFRDGEGLDKDIKGLLAALGAPRHVVTEETRKQVLRWLALGFTQKEMLFACATALKSGHGDLIQVDSILAGWKALGLTRLADIQAYLEESAAREAFAARLLKTAGVPREVSAADLAMVRRAESKTPAAHALLVYAAELSYGMNAPLRMMEKLLKEWLAAGVTSLEEAKAQHEAHTAGRETGRRIPASPDQERQETPEEMQQGIRDFRQEMLRRKQEGADK